MDGQALFYRDTWAEVDLDGVKENVVRLRERLPVEVDIIAVVKANAYGHGDEQVARAAIDGGANYLAVAFLDEALALRQKGLTTPILVLGASRPEDINIAAENNISITVFQYEWLQKAKGMLEGGHRINIHIKADTGMGRIGVKTKEELVAIEALSRSDNQVNIEGFYTHFATADELDRKYFHEQLNSFNEMLEWLSEKPKIIHASNSAAAFLAPEAYFNGVRFGIGMYGLTPSPEIESKLPYPLQEAFSLHSRLVHVKKLEKGEKVSYGATYVAQGDEWIGTMPIGYADGWLRKLQGQEVLIEGMRVPIVGRICMDQCMVKLPFEVPLGTIVTLIGKQGKENISINEIADGLETINYEIPCIISNRVPRIYKKSGKIVELENSLLK